MIKLTISVLLLTLSIKFTHASRINNSLILELPQQTLSKDTNTVNALIDKAGVYFFSKPDSSLYFAQQALDLAHALNFTTREIELLGICGETYRFHGDYPKALEFQFQALELSRKTKNKHNEAVSLGFIGLNYSEMGEHRQGLPYLFAANVMRKQHPNAVSEAFTLSNIGFTYAGLGLLDSALYFLDKAWAQAQEIKHPNLMVLTLRRIGNVKVALGDYVEAMEIYHSALKRARKSNDRVNPSTIQLRIAELHLKLHQKDSVLYYARLAFDDAMASSQREQILQSADYISGIFRERSITDSLIHYQDIVLAMKDSLFGPKKFQKLQGLALREQQRKLDLVHEQDEFKNRSRLLGLSGVLIFVLVLAFILYRNFRQKHKVNLVLEKQKLALEQTLIDLKATQTQLIQSEKMASLGELTAGIAHEIQNPLNFVNNFSEVNEELLSEMKDNLSQGKIDDAIALANNALENQKKINHHGKRADGIVKGMLQHSRASTNQRENTNINLLIDEYVRLAFHGMRAKDKSFNTAIKTDFDESIGDVNIVPQDIGRVILNLLNNAFHAVAEKQKQVDDKFQPAVSISTKRANRSILISVKDNGIGIGPGIKDKIFQPFFTTKPTGQGTGLGLSLSYDIVKAHGGELNVNTSLEEGSEFTFSIPN